MKAPSITQTNVANNLNLSNGLSIAYIEGIHGEDYRVKTSMGTINAIKADSCLLTPAKNDKVLIAEVDYETAIIIAIVKQANRKQQLFQLNPNVYLNANENQLAIISPQIDCISSQETNFYSQKINFTAEKATAYFNHYQLNSDFYNQTVGHYENIAAVVDQTVESYHFNAKNAYQKIAEMHHQVIGDYHTLVEKSYRLDSETVDIYSQGDLKLQGQQIHLA